MDTTPTREITLHHEVCGPPGGWRALLIPGTGCSATIWSPALVDGLVALGLRVVRYDPRDTGSSTHLDDEDVYTMWELADDAATVLEGVGSGPAVLIGHSLGGAVAQLLAVRRPDLVERLVLLATPARPGRGMAIGPEGPLTSTIDWDDPAEALGVLTRSMGDHDEADVAWAADLFRSRPVPMTTRAVRRHASAAMSTTPPTDEELAAVRVPVLILNGSRDDSVFPENALAIAADLPFARVEIIEGMGHWPKPADVAVILDLIADHLADR